MRPRLALTLATVVTMLACGDSKPPAGRDALLDAWKRAGVTVSPLTAAEGAALGGGDCRAGTAAGLDITLCTYADAKAAEGAQPAGLAAVGAATGASLAQGTMLLVVADRRNADPSGRTINQLTKVFRGRT